MPDPKTFDATQAHRLDNPDRTRHVPQAAIVAAVSPYPGIVVADIGSGIGYSLLPIVEAVAGDGTFYALDSQQRMLDELSARLADHPYGAKITPLLTPEDAVALADESVDVVMSVSTYHELPDRTQYNRDILRALKPGGKLVVIDWKPLAEGAERVAGPPADHRVAAEKAHAEMRSAGFAMIEGHVGFELLWTLIATKA